MRKKLNEEQCDMCLKFFPRLELQGHPYFPYLYKVCETCYEKWWDNYIKGIRKIEKKEVRAMRMCDDGHEEVVFESKQCPVCKAMREIDDLERENGELKEELEEVKL